MKVGGLCIAVSIFSKDPVIKGATGFWLIAD